MITLRDNKVVLTGSGIRLHPDSGSNNPPSVSLHSTDFSSYTDGSLPFDWRMQTGQSGYYSVQSTADSNGGKRLRNTGTQAPSDQWMNLIWEDVAPTATVEIVTKIRVMEDLGIDTNSMAGVVARQNGDTYYFAYLVWANGMGRVSIGSRINGVSQVAMATDDNIGWTVGDEVYLRFRVEGDILRLKAWKQGYREPDDWEFQVPNSDITEAGNVGTYAYDQADVDWDWFSVATDGGSAALPPNYTQPDEDPVPDPGDPPPDEEPGTVDGVTATKTFATVTGGEGYPFYKVTNLNDSGSGSLRAALGSNRNVIIEVGGAVELESPLKLTGLRNLTILGSTAPSPGITIARDAMELRDCRNIEIENLRFRRMAGDTSNNRNDQDCLVVMGPKAPSHNGSYGGCENIKFSHCSFAWSSDELLSVWGAPHKNISFEYCILTEPLDFPQPYPHIDEGQQTPDRHGYGPLIFGSDFQASDGNIYRNQGVDFQRCFFGNMRRRMPRVCDGVGTIVANNFILNWYGVGILLSRMSNSSSHGSGIHVGHKMSIVGNILCPGKDTASNRRNRGFSFHTTSSVRRDSTIYFQGNTGWHGATTNPNACYNVPSDFPFAGSPHNDAWVDGLNIIAANTLHSHLVKNLGPRPKDKGGNTYRVEKVDNRAIQQMVDGKNSAQAGNFREDHDGLDFMGLGNNGQTTRQLLPPTYTDISEVRAWIKQYKDEVQYL